MRIRTLPLLVPLVVGAAVSTAAPAERTIAAPRIIMLHGGPVIEPVYLTDWHENLRFIASVDGLERGGRDAMGDRPRIGVGLFWSALRWERFASDTALLRTLRLEDAEERAELLPSRGELRLLLHHASAAWQPGLRRVGPDGEAVLRAHGVPTRLR